MANRFKDLFLQQSYLDSYTEYENSLSRPDYAVWDYIILTASNESQAYAYQQQIDVRNIAGRLPKRSQFAVIPDPDGKRVGSGGATLNVLRYIFQQEEQKNHGTPMKPVEPKSVQPNLFLNKRILCIHSGGDSKRVPQYSACGKLFSPVPRLLPDGRRSTLFDELMIGLSGVPARMSDGMLVCSGDVLLLFNPLQIDFYSKGAAALSIKEDVEIGEHHGVFQSNDKGYVARFLHKQSKEALVSCGAVDSLNKVNLDTGAVMMDSSILRDLYSLVDTDATFHEYVNEHVRLSFYADFLYPLASCSTLEQYYLETPEGLFSDELRCCRTALWQKLNGYSMRLLRLSPASFLHFGTTGELLKLFTDEIENYRFLGWSRFVNTNADGVDMAASNSYISSDNVTIGQGSYIEDSLIDHHSHIGRNCFISGVKLTNVIVPDGTVLHGLRLSSGKFVVRSFGIDDNPKLPRWFGRIIPEALWTSQLFHVSDSMEEAVLTTLARQKTDDDAENKSVCLDGYSTSLAESFFEADVAAIMSWQQMIDDKVKLELLLDVIQKRKSAEHVKTIFANGISDRVKKKLYHVAEKSEFSEKIRVYYYLAKLCKDDEYEKLMSLCFQTIRDTTLEQSIGSVIYNQDLRIEKQGVLTRLPVRVNWGGGWSDTPPYCLENGGTVLNAAITINGIMPIEVEIKRLPQEHVVLASADYDACVKIDNVHELQDCVNPRDPYALHKAALIVCGLIPMLETNETLKEICHRLGGGIFLSTKVINIPRGSGLGTSSILAGACVKGLFEFCGIQLSESDIINRVLCLEQVMSTGGGWQDQVGGLTKGIKMVSSSTGLSQSVFYEPIRLNETTLLELESRFVLIYTGQRRLARNLLREVIGKYIGGDADALDALYEIQRVAVLMRFELEKGNVDGFANLLNDHWILSQKLDSGCTNTCIDQIFVAIDDLIDGKMICGAGGGGFLQIIMKKSVQVSQLKQRLNEVFSDSGVEVWPSEFWR